LLPLIARSKQKPHHQNLLEVCVVRAEAGISKDFVVASKMAKSGSTARQINEEKALKHREQPDRPQMHAAERAELAKYHRVVIDGL
jgi:hypothetical protein